MKEKNSHNINGKWIDCKRAQPKEMVADLPINNNIFLSKVLNNIANNRGNSASYISPRVDGSSKGTTPLNINNNNNNIANNNYGFKETYMQTPSLKYYK